ncbi:hypothetical protein HRF63_00015, partial [Bacillus circulans]|nr:hypothetical protein [Niallia circulans]
MMISIFIILAIFILLIIIILTMALCLQKEILEENQQKAFGTLNVL